MATTRRTAVPTLATGVHRTTSTGVSDAYQVHEDDLAEIAVVCQPGLSKLMVRFDGDPDPVTAMTTAAG